MATIADQQHDQQARRELVARCARRAAMVPAVQDPDDLGEWFEDVAAAVLDEAGRPPVDLDARAADVAALAEAGEALSHAVLAFPHAPAVLAARERWRRALDEHGPDQPHAR